MIDKLRTAYGILHPRSFTVGLKKQYPDVYMWVLAQPDIVPTTTFSNKVYTLLHPIAPICENTECSNVVTTLNREGWAKYCSMQCKGQHNSLKSRDKAQVTSRKNWGVDNPAQHSDIRTKMKKTMLEHHGAEHAKQSEELRAKTEETMLARYNVSYAAQSPVIQAKTKKYWYEKYGVDNPSKRHILQDTFNKLEDKEWLAAQNLVYSLEPLADQLGISAATLGKAFRKLNLVPVRHNIVTSHAETDIVNFIKNNSTTLVVESDRTVIKPFELDIYLPELKLAIEFNGNYWHSELNGKDSKYHLDKTTKCMEQGIHLIHIWEYIYTQKPAIIQSKLNNMLGNSTPIYGRKCEIRVIDTVTAKEFLEDTHLQGYCAATTKLGLYNNNTLVAVMTFGNARFDNIHSHELLRYSSKLNCSVVGGFSKLLQYYVKTFNPESIVSYSDLTWSIGKVYMKNGFTFSHRARPSYYYTNDYVNFEHRMGFQKKKMPLKLQDFDPALSEWANMQNNGYDRIWNCGNDVWVWSKIAN